MAAPIIPIQPKPFVGQTITLNDSTTVIELDPQPYSNTKEVILYNLSSTDPVLVQVANLYGEPATATLNFNRDGTYSGQGALGLRYQTSPGVNSALLTQVLSAGVPVIGDTFSLDATVGSPTPLYASVTGTTGSNLAGSTTFTETVVGAFDLALPGYILYINGYPEQYRITAIAPAPPGSTTLTLASAVTNANTNVFWAITPGGLAGVTTPGTSLFTDASPNAFQDVQVGWELIIGDNTDTVFNVAYKIDNNNIVLSEVTFITTPPGGTYWRSSPGGPGPAPAVITLTGTSTAITAFGTTGSNAAGSTTFAANGSVGGAAVNDSLYISAEPYVITAVDGINNILTVATPIPEEHVNNAEWAVNKRYEFSAPTMAQASITINAVPLPVGTEILFTRPIAPDGTVRPPIKLIGVNGAPALAYLPPSGTSPGEAYFNATAGSTSAIATSIVQAINNIPGLSFLDPIQNLLPLGRASKPFAANQVVIYGMTFRGRVGTLDAGLTPWADRTITCANPNVVITPFTSGVDAWTWSDSPTLLSDDPYGSGIQNVIWNVYKAIKDPGNLIYPYLTPKLPLTFFQPDLGGDNLIDLNAAFVGTNGDNLRVEGVSPAPPTPPASPRRIFVNIATTVDPENLTGGVNALPTAASVSLPTSVYLPAASAITLSIGSEGNRQGLATSSWWSTRPGSKLGIVLRAVSGTNVQVNVTLVQNRGYADGV